ncbi:DUF2252 domain-containing protein [Microbacterium invictum]|uniref:Uncharacterized protein (DUF2252 family) n=1 Tax=Microbacterium invictum TaxID=515415 RepID=A0AA40VLH1_9MICO|nr:DUF2252 domain-containing protein [Microbacterium invictum]MBB4138589.1 uncharacterized protein (DUF2252 family) [Microbacterium invictum]
MKTTPGGAAGNWVAPPSFTELAAEGRAARTRTPRGLLAELSAERREPMAILDEQDTTRVAELIPLRNRRMAASAFAFFRGTAALMAADLANSPGTDLRVGSCGDAHVSNFGLYASPQRTLVFDLNDFDEAAWAPWEWDVKRLVTSIVIAGQSTSRDDRVVEESALAAVRTYAHALRTGAGRSSLARYFDRFDAEAARDAYPEARKPLRAAIRAAEKHTGDWAAERLTVTDDHGRRVFIDDPPKVVHVDEDTGRRVREVYLDYVHSAQVDIRVLLQKYAISDVVRRVVGVGSVGTRCYVLALQDGDGHTMLLQAKEAGRSALIRYGGVPQPEAVSRYIDQYGDGGRVVAMQRILQAVSDPFLGHLRGTPSGGGEERAFYVRQFHDKKGGFDMDTLEDDAFGWYAQVCAATIARAHGQSPAASAVVGYVGGGRAVGEAIMKWSYAYADVSRADWELFRSHRGVADDPAAP